jgi:glycosyltransferase involved in cell wall biosynthesis
VRILFLTPRTLEVARSGGAIKSAALLAHLEREHEVDVAAFGPAWARGSGRTVTMPLSRPRSAGRLVASYLHRVPLSIERNRHQGMRLAVRDLVRDHRPDAVLVDGWLMAQYLPPDAARPLLHQHNAEHRMWRRQAELERSAWGRSIVGAEAARVRAYERSILPRFDVVFAVSEPDRQALLALGAPPPVPLLPNVPEPTLLDRPPLDPIAEPVLLHLGTLSWPPNLAGVLRFLGDGFPALRRRVPDARLVLAGSGAPPALVAAVARTPGAELRGTVEDDEALYREARCFVDVGIGGAGTRVKILNALARGVPVVATRDAAEGLDLGDAALVAEGPSEIADVVVPLLDDDEAWRRLRDAGRSTIRARYVPEVAFAALDAALAGADAGG